MFGLDAQRSSMEGKHPVNDDDDTTGSASQVTTSFATFAPKMSDIREVDDDENHDEEEPPSSADSDDENENDDAVITATTEWAKERTLSNRNVEVGAQQVDRQAPHAM